MKNFILLLLMLISLAGCLRPDDIWVEDSEPVNLIFQSEYTNYAWGYNHNGWIMDNSGKVNRFQKKAAWVFPDSLGYVSAVDMQKNFSACDSVMAQISSKDFSLYAGKAIFCVNGPYTKAVNTMADAGENIRCFYVYEADRKRYKRILLNMTGDWSQENLAPYAKEIADWMKSIK
jgi:hypothetical protein